MIAGLWHVCHKEYELTMFVLSLKMQEVTKLTKQSLMEEAFSEQMKERAEMERKLQKLSKTMDHLERAKREEERPLIEEAHQKRLQDDEKFYKDQQEQAINQSQKQHETDLVEKNRLIHMLEEKVLAMFSIC
jgi:translation initiation factor 3 subunit A